MFAPLFSTPNTYYAQPVHAVDIREAADGPGNAICRLRPIDQGLQRVNRFAPWALLHHVLVAPLEPVARRGVAEDPPVHSEGAVDERRADSLRPLAYFICSW